MEPYCGASTQLDKTTLGKGPDVVLGLAEKAGISPGGMLYFDNLFTSVPLLVALSEKGNIHINKLNTWCSIYDT